MASQAGTTWLRSLLFIGLVGGLGGVLTWQRWQSHLAAELRKKLEEQDREIALKAPVIPERKYDVPLEKVSDELRIEAEAAAPKIQTLRKARADATQWPYLIVPLSPQAETQAKVNAEYLQFRLRELEAYRQLTQDTGSAKAAGEAFLEAYLTQVADRDEPTRDFTALNDLGQAAIIAGSHDPLIRTFATYCRWQLTKDEASAFADWEALIEELPQTKYPRIVATYAALFILDANTKVAGNEKRMTPTIVQFVEWLEEEADAPRWTRCVFDRLWSVLQGALRGRQQQFVIACAMSKKIDPYIMHSLLGQRYINIGWSHRGSGWAVDVQPERWEGFDKNLKLASTHLQYAWSLRPELPYAPSWMITIAMAGKDSENGYYWWLRTTEAQSDYAPAYESFGYSLTSRWGGSRKDLYQFAHNCLETLRFDTLVPYQAVQMLQHVQNWELGEDETLAFDPSAQKLLRRFVELRQTYRDDPQHLPMFEDDGRYRAELLQLLEDAELTKEAGALLVDVGTNLHWPALRRENRRANFLAARRLAQHHLGDRINDFDQRLQQRRTPPINPQGYIELETERLRLQDEYRRLAKPDETFADYFAHAEAIIAQERTFHTGEWVSLPLTAGLPGWEPYADKWSLEDGGRVTLVGLGGHTKQVALRPLATFTPPLEVEVDVELLEPQPHLEAAGIGWSREGMSKYKKIGPGLSLFSVKTKMYDTQPPGEKRRREMAGVWSNEDYPLPHHPLSTVGNQRLKLKLWPDYVEYCVDDSWYTVNLKNGLHAEGWLCFGQAVPDWYWNGTERSGVHFGNIRVRRLDLSLPPPADADLTERAAYWEFRYQENPQGLVEGVRLAGIRTEQYRHEDVLALVNALLERAPLAQGIRRWRAIVLARMRRDAEALADFELTLSEWVEDFDALAKHVDLLVTTPEATLRNGEQALKSAQLLIQYQGVNAGRASYQALAAAHAELGQFDEAVAAQIKAMEADASVADVLSTMRLENYRAGKPWRLPAVTVSP